MTNLEKCPKCGGIADNGFDRCMPPTAYYCSKCEIEYQWQSCSYCGEEELTAASDWTCGNQCGIEDL